MLKLSKIYLVTGDYFGKRYSHHQITYKKSFNMTHYPSSYNYLLLWVLNLEGILSSYRISDANLQYFTTRNMVFMLKYSKLNDNKKLVNENLIIDNFKTLNETYYYDNIYTVIARKANNLTAFMISNYICSNSSLGLSDRKVPLEFRILFKSTDFNLITTWIQTKQGLPYLSIQDNLKQIIPDAVIQSDTNTAIIYTLSSWTDRTILACRGQFEFMNYFCSNYSLIGYDAVSIELWKKAFKQRNISDNNITIACASECGTNPSLYLVKLAKQHNIMLFIKKGNSYEPL